MGTLGWTHHERIAWTDVDQDGLLKYSSIFRFVAAGYAGMFPLLTKSSRADYFATHELQPILRQVEVARDPRAATLDAALSLHFAVRLGFTLDGRSESRRYGGHDAIAVVNEHGEALGDWTQQWLWFVPDRGALLHEPAPGMSIDQSEELPATEVAPRSSTGVEAGGFRWTPRETDANRHVTAYAYLERAENALADAEVDAGRLHRASMWFRRPSRLGDRMACSLEEVDDDTVLVLLRHEESEELCVTVRFRGRASAR